MDDKTVFEIASKIGKISDSNISYLKHSKEGTTVGSNTLQDMINIEKGTENKEK